MSTDYSTTDITPDIFKLLDLMGFEYEHTPPTFTILDKEERELIAAGDFIATMNTGVSGAGSSLLAIARRAYKRGVFNPAEPEIHLSPAGVWALNVMLDRIGEEGYLKTFGVPYTVDEKGYAHRVK